MPRITMLRAENYARQSIIESKPTVVGRNGMLGKQWCPITLATA